MKRVCGQVEVPIVDNTKDECEFFVSSKCVAVDRKSTFIQNVYGNDLNEYFEILENKLKKMQNQISLLEQQVEVLLQNQPVGIGVFD